jgi:hypothetical protein
METKLRLGWEGSLVEVAAVLDGSLRTYNSRVSGQTCRIRPTGGRRRYGVFNLLQFVIADRLFKAGLPRKGIQCFLDNFAEADFIAGHSFTDRMRGFFIISENPADDENVDIYFFHDELAFWAAVKVLTESPLRFVLLHLDSIVSEVFGRLSAWQQRKEYVAHGREDMLTDALKEIREVYLLREENQTNE